MKKILILLFVATLLVLINYSCEKENIPPNNPPTIQSTTASPATIKNGETTQLTCVAIDPDGEPLTYSWSSSNGEFPSGTNGSSVVWEASDEFGIFKISVIVNDGKDVVDDSVDVIIEKRIDTYKEVKIGEQIWMAENLADYIGVGCWAYDNDESNVATYGMLYTWDVAKSVCPSGWHLPTDSEWKQLEMAIGIIEMCGRLAENHYLRNMLKSIKVIPLRLGKILP